MENQSLEIKLSRVKSIVIDPMKALWNAKFDASTTNAFAEELGNYTDETLGKAMKELRRKHQKKPNLATIIATCEATLITAKAPDAGTIIRKLSPQEIDAVMRGPIGDMAFSEGWWFQLYEHLSLRATSEIVTQEDSDRCRKEHKRAWTDQRTHAEIEKCSRDFKDSFHRMHNSFKRKKEEILRRYDRSAA